MKNFSFYSPTKVIFGKDVQNAVGEEVVFWGGTKAVSYTHLDVYKRQIDIQFMERGNILSGHNNILCVWILRLLVGSLRACHREESVLKPILTG